MAKIAVKFKSAHGPFNAGETAAFDEKRANSLISAGKAVKAETQPLEMKLSVDVENVAAVKALKAQIAQASSGLDAREAALSAREAQVTAREQALAVGEQVDADGVVVEADTGDAETAAATDTGDAETDTETTGETTLPKQGK